MATLLEARLRLAPVDTDWGAVRAPDVPLLLLDRPAPLPEPLLLGLGPLDLRLEAAPDDIAPRLVAAGLPAALAADIAALAARFAALMAVDTVRLRLERIEGDACRRFHADYTDLRLVTTYAGPGTDVRETTADDAPVVRLAAGQIGLFKGRLHPGKPPVLLHRSPPVAGCGTPRLVLVIDTPGPD